MISLFTTALGKIPSLFRDLLSVGYRPFFILAGVNAWASMLPWLYLLSGGRVPTQGWSPQTLHAHEMIYGTVVPVIAGFLLTAVPNWTSTVKVSGGRLFALVVLYLAGRVALLFSGSVGSAWTAGIDLVFVPVVACVVAAPILRTRNWRNLPVVGVLLGLTVANVAIHWGLAHSSYRVLRLGTYSSVYIVVILMIIIAGRVVPLFTRNALKQSGLVVRVKDRPWPRWLSIAFASSALLIDLVDPGNQLGSILALGAATLLLIRQSGWQFRDTLGRPMLWILHVGHAWLAVGFACIGMSNLFGIGIGAAALHPFTAGAMGTLILGMMPRVSLGHSGRPIEATRMTVWMFGCVIIGASIRIMGAFGPAEAYQPSILLGGLMWAFAWFLFCVLYSKVLVQRRVNSKA